MKAVIKSIVVLLAISIHFTSHAGDATGGIEINGLEVGGKYTREQIFAALGGEPDKIVQGKDDPTYYEYHYGRDVFCHMGDEFHGGSITTSRFMVSEGIKIGDNVVKVNKLNGACYSGDFDESKYAGVVKWRPSRDPKWEWLIVEFYYDSQGLIARIEISIFYL